MKNFAKLMVLLICICMVLGMVACGNSQPGSQETQGDSQPAWMTMPTGETDTNPDENQCAADATTEETDYPTEPSVPETTVHEVDVEEPEETQTYSPEVEEDPGDIHIPMPSDPEYVD